MVVATGPIGVEPDIVEAVPGYRVVVVRAYDLRVPPAEALASFVERSVGRGVAALEVAGPALRDQPALGAWSRAYRAVGLDDRSFPPSVLALARRARAGAIPSVHPIVDLYNAVSVAHLVGVGADDLATVDEPLAIRRSPGGEPFTALDGTEASTDESEVVLADQRRVLCRRWIWRQAAATALSPRSNAAILTVSTAGDADVDAAVADLVEALERMCGATIR